ncbi:MAG: hypothetical protein C4K48_03165 [Candidatus Thorarchaeota archaeon]|nr:MAG: hypothetical protein C4K48_03165 [Candidatus Thorarchaeota archaeon]
MANVSRKSRKDVQAQSTVEAIRMASASVLSTTTGLGYPVGSARGAGSMLEQHSETVSMSIAPLIFNVRDTLNSSEGLELLSIEWNLERTPGPGVLPEQLIVVGGSEGGVGSHVCVLCWERGVVDPFRIDQYVKVIAKKLGDIEAAVINNDLNYDLDGLSVIRRFADRLNSVLFVDMLDRRFQGTWDSLQVKDEQMAVEAIAKMSTYDDFTLVPPGLKIARRNSLEFRLPSSSKEDFLDQFQHRVLTPSAIEMLTKTVPETGQAILNELNTYAYAREEADVAEGTISVLKEYLKRDTVKLSDLQSIKKATGEFVGHLNDTVDSLESIVDQHSNSGKALTIAGHRDALLSDIDANHERFDGINGTLAHMLIVQIMKSIGRESFGVEDIRAWQLRSALSYAIAYAKRVAQYFAEELDHYLIASAARKAFFVALRDFRQETVQVGMDSTDLMLFEKFYAEVQSQLNASFSRKSYQGVQYHDFIQLMDTITREIIETFRHIDVWNLINFSDVADIARSEIQKRHAGQSSDGALMSDGNALMSLLNAFQNTVSDIIPDVADTILSKSLIRKMIEKIRSDGTGLGNELASAIESVGEKSQEWKREAVAWVEGFRDSVDPTQSTPVSLLALLQYIHELLDQVVSPSAMADRVKAEADAKEAVYQAKVNDWQFACKEIEKENVSIRQRNNRREELIAEATRQFEMEMSAFEQQVRDYQEKVEQRESLAASAAGAQVTLPALPLEPVRPSPLGPRVDKIRGNNPTELEKSFPPEPQPEPTLRYYTELRDLLYDKLSEMKEREKSMEETFARRVLRLQAEGMGAIGEIDINIGDDFLQHLMDSRIRTLGRLLPRISRVFLRNPKIPGLLYLVSYAYYKEGLTMSIGSTFLR